MTFHTLRYLHGNYLLQNQFYSVTSPEGIKKLIWERIKPTIQSDNEKVAFMKGIKLCDFGAIFDWLVDERGYYYKPQTIAIELLKALKQPSNEVAVT